MGIQPGRKRGKSRTAKSGRHIPTTEQSTLRGQLIEMRSFDVRMPHESVIGVGLIIREDQDNIGRFSSANKYKGQVDKEEGFFDIK